jgi:hypothetical protein
VKRDLDLPNGGADRCRDTSVQRILEFERRRGLRRDTSVKKNFELSARTSRGSSVEHERTSMRAQSTRDRSIRSDISLIATASLALSICVACEAPPDPRRTNFEIRAKEGVAKYDPKTGKLQRFDADLNKNGKMETFSYWDGGRVIRIEIDKDEDGKIDRWEHYDQQNKIERVGSSSKDDEVEDTWTYPDERGFLARVESDADRDGSIDRREIFVPRVGKPDGRVLSIVELDIDKSGKPARRLHYRPDGSFEKTEVLR